MLTLVVFVLVLNLLVLAHELGHAAAARAQGIQVEEFGLGLPPRLCVLAKRGGTLFTLNAAPLGGFVKLQGENDPLASGGFARTSLRTRFAVFVAGPLSNISLALALSFLCYWGGWPEAVDAKVMISHVAPGSPAEMAGLKQGDFLLEVNGAGVQSPSELTTLARGGISMTITVKREQNTLFVPVAPRREPPHGEGPLGIITVLEPTGFQIKRYPAWESFVRGSADVVGVIALTIATPVLFLARLLPKEMLRPVGPVGLADLVGQATLASLKTGWLFPLLRLTAILSTGLAVTNLLPLPGLDGGRILFLLVEAVRGKRMDPKTEEAINRAGLTVLLVIIALVTLNDLVHPVPPAFEWVKLLINDQ